MENNPEIALAWQFIENTGKMCIRDSEYIADERRDLADLLMRIHATYNLVLGATNSGGRTWNWLADA